MLTQFLLIIILSSSAVSLTTRFLRDHWPDPYESLHMYSLARFATHIHPIGNPRWPPRRLMALRQLAIGEVVKMAPLR